MNTLKQTATPSLSPPDPVSVRRRALVAGCGAHAVHDGLTDVIYVLLPIWQAQFGLSYAQIALLPGAYAGQGKAMSGTGGPWGPAVPGMGRSLYAGVNYKF